MGAQELDTTEQLSIVEPVHHHRGPQVHFRKATCRKLGVECQRTLLPLNWHHLSSIAVGTRGHLGVTEVDTEHPRLPLES